MKSFLTIALFLCLGVNAMATNQDEWLSEEDAENVLDTASSKYSCKACTDYYTKFTDGRKFYAYSVYSVYYDGKFHSESEHFASRGKCAAAYDSDYRCAK